MREFTPCNVYATIVVTLWSPNNRSCDILT